jgi:hypothetical protein
MRNLLLLPLVMLAACTMYGTRAEPLHKVAKLPVKEDPIAKAKPQEYIETCSVSFHDPATKVRRQPVVAQQRAAAGEQKVDAGLKVAEPEKRAALFTDGIQQFRAALVQDPFDADATVGLARAYDGVYRKGCALKLLDRLALLAQNPKLAPKAQQLVQDVQSHDDWFKDYRSAAKDAALGVRP